MKQIYTGDGHGKSLAALGKGIVAAAEGKSVVVIQFLKGDSIYHRDFFSRLEPELKIFRFEKDSCEYDELTESGKEDAIINIKNGLNYAKKVLSTGECDLLILDEILGVVDNGIMSAEELKDFLLLVPEYVDVIMTGIHMQEEIVGLADEISRIDTV